MIVFHNPKKHILNNTNIEVVNSAKHLGIERNPNNTPDVDSRIQTARKTVYALLGSGLHGKNGISRIISFHMWSTFVIPRLLHGIELLNIRKSDIDTLERYQRKFLKQIQALSERTASVAVLTRLGAKTIEAQIATKIITTFLNIAKDSSTFEFQIAIRQLTVKADSSNSWFIKVKNILHKYDLTEADHHNYVLELQAALFALKSICSRMSNIHIPAGKHTQHQASRILEDKM